MTLLAVVIPTEQAWCFGDMALACIVPLTLLSAVFVTMTSGKFCRIGLIDIVSLTWCLFTVGYAYVVTTFPVASIVVRSVLLLMMFFALRVCIARHRYYSDVLAILIVAITLAEALLGIYQAVTGSSRNSHFPMTGTFLNPGPYGALLACGLITLLALRKKYSGIIKMHKNSSLLNVAILIAAALMSFMLLMTMSRAAILAFSVCLFCMYRDRIRIHLLPISIILISALALYLIKQDSANSRFIIWQVSLRNISMHAIVGTCPGSFLHQYADGMALLSSTKPDGYFNSTDVVQYAFNFLLLIGVEQGFIGILFAATIIFAVFLRLYSSTNIMKWILPLLFITSLFTYTIELLPFQVLIVIACASLLSDEDSCRPAFRINAVPALFLCLFVSLCVVPIVIERVSANNRYQKIRGILTPEYIQDYYALYPYMNDNPVFLFDFARILSNAMRFNDSNAVLRDGMLVSADPMFIVLQANNFRDMGEFDLAEEYYRRAFAVMPNRLYPLYRLMKLYADMPERHSDALYMARRIIAFPVKITSPATERMEDEAKSIVKSFCQ